jgi:hypothetical protein
MAGSFPQGTRFDSEFRQLLIRVENIFFCGLGSSRRIFHFPIILVDGEGVS